MIVFQRFSLMDPWGDEFVSRLEQTFKVIAIS